MGIIVGEDTRALVQGITGAQGSFHTKQMLEYGTKIVAGVTPGKGGAEVYGVPVYDTVRGALREHEVNASIIFVPARFAFDAALEALEEEIKTVVLITEHIPIKDSIHLMAYAKEQKSTIIGPNTPGIITPEECKLGIMPGHIFIKGNVGVTSRSGTLTYEVASELTRHRLGQSTCLGLGGDPIVGLSFVDALKLYRDDQNTQAVVLIGEIGGDAEERAARYISSTNYGKPVVAFIAGRTAPPGKRMGHAGAIVIGHKGTAENKINALRTAKVQVATKPSEIPRLLRTMIKSHDKL